MYRGHTNLGNIVATVASVYGKCLCKMYIIKCTLKVLYGKLNKHCSMLLKTTHHHICWAISEMSKSYILTI